MSYYFTTSNPDIESSLSLRTVNRYSTLIVLSLADECGCKKFVCKKAPCEKMGKDMIKCDANSK